MDSGNTSGGSMQSSSSAEEEYNSRAQSSPLSAFLTNQPPPTTNQLAQPFISSLMFDPLSNYLDPITQRSNLDMMWPNSKSPRSEQNQTDLGALMNCSIPSSSNSPSQNQPFLSRGTNNNNNNNSATFSASTHQILPPESGSRGPMLSVSAANNDQTNNNNNMVRNPKKRSRASRRAPTTVLTTDTTNFRAMVQEFTGIPAPPFTPSPFPRTRFDLFAMRPNSNNPPTTTTPPYLLRPFPQKLHPFHNPHSFSTTVLPSNSNNSTNNNNNCSANSTSSINYQQQLEPLNILTYQNHPLAYSSFLLSKIQPSLEIPPNLKMGVLEDLGFRHDHVNNTCLHQNMVSSTTVGAGAMSNSVNNNNNNLNNASSSTEWAPRTCTITSNDCDHGEGGVKCYSDDFHGEKGPEFSARSQGMVESWINCSSD